MFSFAPLRGKFFVNLTILRTDPYHYLFEYAAWGRL
jgi:hypothetical protein